MYTHIKSHYTVEVGSCLLHSVIKISAYYWNKLNEKGKQLFGKQDETTAEQEELG